MVFPNHRSGFTSNSAFINGGNTFDDLPVEGNDIIRFADKNIALLQLTGWYCCDHPFFIHNFCGGFFTRLSQRIRLSFPTGFSECLNAMQQGNVAMWYDATSAAGSLEADNSPVKGKVGYVAAPVLKTEESGWLYTWAWAIQKASKKQDNAWKFISWASSADYEKLVGDLDGAYSRRINIQHRLVYEVFKKERTVRVLRMWTHYE